MRCTSPRTVGFHADGKTISWSQKHYSKEYASFQLPCGKCLSCRLEYARQWAVRCVHEAQMHEENIFVTLTYNEENLKSEKLQYRDFQLFAKRLRQHLFIKFLSMYGEENWKLLSKQEKKQIYDKHKIGIFVTGEYGEKNKRPHWHACIFNYRPSDSLYKYSTDRGDKVFTSEVLTDLWSLGGVEYGDVTFESAGYCARYAAKKLTHGNDGTHQFDPISKKSSHNAIGKRWIEKFWPDVFNLGKVVLKDGTTTAIPRYYEKWLQKHKPEEWSKYVTKKKADKTQKATMVANLEKQREKQTNDKRRSRQGISFIPESDTNKARKIILEQKFNQLQKNLKL